MSEVLGVIVIARNGDRQSYYQDPKTYAGALTETTALGEVQSHQLGTLLRKTYFDSSSSSYISGMSTELVDNKEVKVRVKAGGEGTVVFDSAIALLQGLYPPNPKNKIVLANGDTVVAPLGGYQYVPVETVEPANDRSLESWTDCPAFQKHISKFHASDEFKEMADEAKPFFKNIQDYVFGRPTTLENIWNIHDFISSQLLHNQTYAFRLPPGIADQAHALANWHENGVFSDEDQSGIGNIAGRTVLNTVLSSLERIAFNADPLQFLLVETTYQPFISLFHGLGIIKEHPELAAIPDYASALTIELRRGSPPDLRDFLRFQFKNGTSGDFEPVHVFGNKADIPLTEFIYRSEGSAIGSNKEWAAVCGGKSAAGIFETTKTQVTFTTAFAIVMMLGFFIVSHLVKRSRSRKVKLEGPEILNVQAVMEKSNHPITV
ncbi:histidine phosphatase superfamily [Mycena floridula]|nr:histidine phosphatase superfamily [Mycena floridula]